MTIQNFPAALQPIIQSGYLERAFDEALNARLGFRAIADREEFGNRVGETVTKTRPGLLPVVTTPIDPTSNTGLDNGLTPGGWTVEQYTLAIAEYGSTLNLNTVQDRVGIASQFVQNAVALGEQARRSLDTLARDALFGVYLGGNSRVYTALAAAGPSVAIDDLRGFGLSAAQLRTAKAGLAIPVAAQTVTIGSGAYTLASLTVDAANVSTAPGGVSGTLTLTGNVATSDAAANSPVVAATAPLVLRPNGRTSTAALEAGDTLAMVGTIMLAANTMRDNGVPDIDGLYNCYLSNMALQGLFNDPQFQLLFRGAYGADAYRRGTIVEIGGVRFIPTNNTPVPQALADGVVVRRSIVCGKGALIEGDFAGQDAGDTPQDLYVRSVVDGISMITREPMDRLAEQIAQSWKWIGGFCVPSDTTANPSTIPTASNSAYKRAVVIESL